MYIISHTFRNSSLDYEQTIRKLNLGVNCLMYLPVHEQQRLWRVCADVPACVKSLMNTFKKFMSVGCLVTARVRLAL